MKKLIYQILKIGFSFLVLISALAHASYEDGLNAYQAENYALALQEFLPLAVDGNAEAQLYVGYIYDAALGVEQNLEIAFQWYQKAADAGLAQAQYNLGVLYYNGDGVAEDDAEALYWLKQAALQGHSGAFYVLGIMVEEGYGVDVDMQMALFNYYVSATLGKEQANEAITRVSASLSKVEQNEAMIAGAGFLYSLAEYELAWESFVPFAQADNPEAAYYLGLMLRNGEGVSQNYAAAAEWYQKAVDGGYTAAYTNLAFLYIKGLGVDQDYHKALSLYVHATQQGDADAAANIAHMYQDGLGVEASLVEAYAWWLVAAENGSEDASEKLASYQSNLSADELALAKNRASIIQNALGQGQDPIELPTQSSTDGKVASILLSLQQRGQKN
ncbi:MAG: sel1 repeat family protein [Trueperaceae bacterium]|nr:sel1 repeat family protein [Trueperaceae bacterium]